MYSSVAHSGHYKISSAERQIGIMENPNLRLRDKYSKQKAERVEKQTDESLHEIGLKKMRKL